MPQPHGLGRGLASLIPQKNTSTNSNDDMSTESVAVPSKAGNSSLPNPFLGAKKMKIAPGGAMTPSSDLEDANQGKESSKKMSSLANLVVPKKPRANISRVTESQSNSKPLKKVEEVKEENLPVKKTEPSTVLEQTVVKSEEESQKYSDRIEQIPPANIVPNPHQPRIHFDEDKLTELAQSIKEHGILQPIIVTRTSENSYELIAGERRLEAAKMVGLPTVPAIVRAVEDQKKFELAIIENIQRHNLNPIEEARAYDRLSKEFDMAQEAIAEKMGKSRSAVANTMRLLHLPVEVQRAVMEGKLSEGHAKALLSISNPEKQRALFDMIVREGLTVREAEEKSRLVSNKPPRRVVEKDPETKAREESLSEVFGTKVRISRSGSGGSIRIEYYSPEEFQNIVSKLSKG